MARNQRTKITLKDMGEPAVVKMPAYDQAKMYVLGTLVGIATKIVERQSPKPNADGSFDKFEGLGGSFRVIPSDPNKDEIEAGVLFIPDAFHNMIAGILRPMLVTDANAELKFAFEVSSIRASNPAGYSWDFKPMIEGQAKNPLDEFIESEGILQLASEGTTLAIEDRSKKAVAKKAAKKK